MSLKALVHAGYVTRCHTLKATMHAVTGEYAAMADNHTNLPSGVTVTRTTITAVTPQNVYTARRHGGRITPAQRRAIEQAHAAALKDWAEFLTL